MNRGITVSWIVLALIASRVLSADAVTGAGAYPTSPKPNLVPLQLRLPAPSFQSGPVDWTSNPRIEPRPDRPRPPFLAPVGTTNLALERPVTASDKSISEDNLMKFVDGDKEFTDQSVVTMRRGAQWVQVDLGESCPIYAVVIWHDERRRPVYQCVVVRVSDDPEFAGSTRTLFNNDYENLLGFGAGTNLQYLATYEGKLIDARGVKARYIRCYSKGSQRDVFNDYTEIEVWGLPARNAAPKPAVVTPEESSVDETKALAIARTAVAANETWAERAEFHAPHRLPDRSGWSVTVWRLPQTPGGFRIVTIDNSGRVISYRRGH